MEYTRIPSAANTSSICEKISRDVPCHLSIDSQLPHTIYQLTFFSSLHPKFALTLVYQMFSYWAKPEHTLKVSKFLNDDIAKTVDENPDKFFSLGTLPMNDPNLACKELKRCVEELGIRGFQIGSHINDKTLADKSFKKVWDVAEEMGAAIMVHPWDMVGFDLMEKYWLPWLVGMPAECSLAICSCIFGGVFENNPNVRWLFAHGGGSFPFTLGRIEHGFNVRPDLCQVDCKVNPREYIRHFWVDAITHDMDAFKYNLKLFGDEKIVCGSDYPFVLGEQEPGKLVCECDDLTEQSKDKILYTNVLDWLGVPKSER
mmetsp:Transcript_3238/g.12362  ORF Transcript_3238/g.12362 Transcript_3238/m.12362 type:complete len:315 (-) Transcript_3238:123-1067(-)